jgi:hypothetical protein
MVRRGKECKEETGEENKTDLILDKREQKNVLLKKLESKSFIHRFCPLFFAINLCFSPM